MRFKRTYNILLFSALLICGMAVYAQPPGIRESLVESHRQLLERENSLLNELNRSRELYASDTTARQSHATTILALEKELYLLRDSLDAVSAQIKAAGIGEPVGKKPEKTTADGAGDANITMNGLLTANLPEADQKQLVTAQDNESAAAALVRSIKSRYDEMAALDSLYLLATTGNEAMPLFEKLTELEAENRGEVELFEEMWNDIFDTKIYTYNWLLDRTGQTSMMSEMERRMSNVRLRMAELKGEYMYDAIAAYPFQKALLLRYEIGLADGLGMTQAADSLRGAAMKAITLNEFLLPKLEIEERLFLDYSDIAVANPPKYTTKSIPATEIHPTGTIYRLFLGAFNQAQPISLFRGVYPLSVERRSDKRYYYYIGGYATYEEAVAGAAKAKKIGFKNPRVVVWHDGVYSESPTQGAPARLPSGQKAKQQLRYRMEISETDGNLPAEVRSIISAMAPGKEISRAVGSDSGVVFTVGSFTDKREAESLAHEINSQAPALNINIFAVP